MNALLPSQLAGIRTLLTVWAHPDDESYLAGGLMAATAAWGGRVVCVTATYGEQGTSDPAWAGSTDFAHARAAELDAALTVLGVQEHVALGYPDGGCADIDADTAAVRMAQVLGAVDPDVVVTFDPDGFTGHDDHKAVSRWTTAAFRAAARPGARLLHATMTPERAADFADVNAGLGVFPDGGPPLTPRHALALSLRLEGELLERKVTALEAHASQTKPVVAALGRECFAAWVAAEDFVAAPDPGA